MHLLLNSQLMSNQHFSFSLTVTLLVRLLSIMYFLFSMILINAIFSFVEKFRSRFILIITDIYRQFCFKWHYKIFY